MPNYKKKIIMLSRYVQYNIYIMQNVYFTQK